MTNPSVAWTAYASTALFVLLWGSGAIFTKWGLDHAPAFAFLLLRFALALFCLSLIGMYRRRWLPRAGSRSYVFATGALMIGAYAICYFLAMAQGITPGLLATVLGIQPILTLMLLERRFSPLRMVGLCVALMGLVLVVYQSVVLVRFSLAGIGLALGALGCMTVGAIMQKRIRQSPAEVLPLQYVASLVLCLPFAAVQPVAFAPTWEFLVPLLWLAVVISVVAQLLLYRLIQAGNLVNVTSLFYLVPVATAVMDYLFLGNSLPMLSLTGMALILFGLALVFRQPAMASRQ
ncbi:Threonine/homoserine efflux transporter RhtA [Franzmannia pantelleriensis]|uniref:Threonine/homoserine efflux transporter RhtA n=1 Tax=Franzmannia pantelleriensis TaxID=48727 RepID=A0A1G9NB43_9GAMM|nr:DMT family transporter [Halomonas pantelleriensis]SDL83682.1 Threonine/homoserine efflux transporter RhtA [Halomonas pantelleriensis]